MLIKHTSSEELYAFDLYESWWHYFMLELTWFFPHKAYKIQKIEISNKNKQTRKFGLMGDLAIVSGKIISDLLNKIDIYRIPKELLWISNLLIYPLLVLTIYVIWKIIRNISIVLRVVTKMDIYC